MYNVHFCGKFQGIREDQVCNGVMSGAGFKIGSYAAAALGSGELGARVELN